MLTANSFEFGKNYDEISLMIVAAFANTSWGDYLTMRAAEFGVIRKTAVAATVDLTVTGTVGSTVIKGSIFATAESLNFYTLADATIGSNGTAIITAQCSTSGTTGNVIAGTIINIPYSIPGITAVNNVSAAQDGYDGEADDNLLSRYLLKVRTPATSGNTYHYQQWALSVSGVGQVKVLPLWNGNGTVKVIIVDADNVTAGTTLIQSVADYIETVRPIGATVTVTSPAPLPINIVASITGTGNADTVKAAINSYFKANGFSLSYVSVAKIGKILLDSGITDYDYDSLQLNGSNKDITLTDDQIPTCGTVTLNDS